MTTYIGYIYKITCIPTNKSYVGSKVSETFVESYWSSSKNQDYWDDLEKYGKENFRREILAWCNTLEELREVEKHYILSSKSLVTEGGYNLSYGAHNIIFTDKIKDTMSKNRKKAWERLTKEEKEEWSLKCSKRNLNPNGVYQSQEYKSKMRLRSTGKHNLTEEGRERKRQIGYNQQCSKETRLHLAKIRKGRDIGKHWWNNGADQKFTYECPGDGWVKGRLNPHWNQRNYEIYCIELNKKFNTYKEAANFICKDPLFLKSTARQISRRCIRKDNLLVGGYHWELITKGI